MQADFYLFSSNDINARDLFICRLVEKIARQQQSAYIHCKDRQEMHRLDELLWTFNDISFIPHNLLGEGPDAPPPIQLGFDGMPMHKNILINLSSTIPMFYEKFQRIIEIVLEDETLKTISREHYQFYKSKNFVLNTHKITQ